MDFVTSYLSPLGEIRLASDGEALIGLWFEGQAHFGATLRQSRENAQLPVFDEARRWLDLYFSGREPEFTPPLRLRGTPFQRRVWELLLRIPYGQRRSYGALARELGKAPGSARAVGNAVGRNPVSLIVPCHRVVGADGSLTGYAGGMQRKSALLQLEGGKING